MNTKTITSGAEIKSAPQQVPAKLDTESKSKVADASAKSATQAAVSAVVQPPKGNAMATEKAQKTLAELMQEKAALENSIKQAMSVERPNALARIKDEVAMYNFTAKELGLASAAPAAAAPAAPAEAKPAKTVLLSYKGNGPKSTTFAKGDKLPSPQKAFRDMYEKDTKNFAENIKAHYQPGAAEYFETKEGKDELAYFIKQTTRPVTPRAPAAA